MLPQRRLLPTSSSDNVQTRALSPLNLPSDEIRSGEAGPLVPLGTSLPDGDFDGQTLAWDAATSGYLPALFVSFDAAAGSEGTLRGGQDFSAYAEAMPVFRTSLGNKIILGDDITAEGVVGNLHYAAEFVSARARGQFFLMSDSAFAIQPPTLNDAMFLQLSSGTGGTYNDGFWFETIIRGDMPFVGEQGQSIAVADTPLPDDGTIPPAGLYFVIYELYTTVVGNAVNAALHIKSTDITGAGAEDQVSANRSLASLGRTRGTFVVGANGVNPITYGVTLSGAAGTGRYGYTVWMHKLVTYAQL